MSGRVACSGICTPVVRVFVDSPAIILLVDISIAAAAQRFQQSDNLPATITNTTQQKQINRKQTINKPQINRK